MYLGTLHMKMTACRELGISPSGARNAPLDISPHPTFTVSFMADQQRLHGRLPDMLHTLDGLDDTQLHSQTL